MNPTSRPDAMLTPEAIAEAGTGSPAFSESGSFSSLDLRVLPYAALLLAFLARIDFDALPQDATLSVTTDVAAMTSAEIAVATLPALTLTGCGDSPKEKAKKELHEATHLSSPERVLHHPGEAPPESEEKSSGYKEKGQAGLAWQTGLAAAVAGIIRIIPGDSKFERVISGTIAGWATWEGASSIMASGLTPSLFGTTAAALCVLLYAFFGKGKPSK